MEHSLATVLPWALLLLFVVLLRDGAWRAAVPLLEGCAAPPGPLPGEVDRAAQPAGPEEACAAKAPRRRLRLPGPLACAVVATALVRLGVLVAAGR